MHWALQQDFRAAPCCLPQKKCLTFLCPPFFLCKMGSTMSAFSLLPREEQDVIKTSVSHLTSPLGYSAGHVAPNNLPAALPLSRPAVFSLRGPYSSEGNGKVVLLAGDTPQCGGHWQSVPRRGLGVPRASCFAQRARLAARVAPENTFWAWAGYFVHLPLF